MNGVALGFLIIQLTVNENASLFMTVLSNELLYLPLSIPLYLITVNCKLCF